MRFRLSLAIIAGLAGPAHGDATLFGTFDIPKDIRGMGGLSGIEIEPDPKTIWLITDTGTLFTGEIKRDSNGQIADITNFQRGPLPVSKYFEGNLKIDSEGLALHDYSQMFVSFEQNHLVMRFLQSGHTRPVGELPDSITTLPSNKGLEALAISATGTLVAIPEKHDHALGFLPVYAHTQAGWIIIAKLPTSKHFRATGADFGPDGLLYVVLRRTSPLGFQTKIQRLDLAAQTAETLVHTGWGVHGNLEGIAAWTPPQGGIMLTLVADNNFLAILPNEVVEYHIPD